MNDEVKEILIDLVDYWNAMGTDDDFGFEKFENVVQRSSKALEQEAAAQQRNKSKRSIDVDPFAIDVVGSGKAFKHENDLY